MIMTELKILDSRYTNGTWELPTYATSGSAGLDLRAALPLDQESIIIEPNSSQLIPSGLSVHIADPNYVLFLLPRSGMGCKQGIVLGNLTGVIDSDYQGELKICVWNRTDSPVTIQNGSHICQAVLLKTEQMTFNIVDEFSTSTIRGENGFGTTKC